jgi:hypothetical protein
MVLELAVLTSDVSSTVDREMVCVSRGISKQ